MNPAGVLVLGSINVDLVVRGPRLPRPGETVVGGRFFQASGGKGANQAVAAARAGGGPVRFLSAVGDDDLGRWALDQLRAERLDLSAVRVMAQQPTGVALILVDAEGENLISVASGANHALEPADVDRLPEQAWTAGGVLLASLEIPLEVVQRGLTHARAAGLTTVLNPAPADPRVADPEMLSLVDLLTPNEHEAEALTGLPVSTIDEALAAGRALCRRGCASCLITLGPQGSVLVGRLPKSGVPEGPEEWHLPAPRMEAVDTTAAGDAFSGALAVALASGLPLDTAGRWATCAAAISVTRAGAQPSLPQRDEIERAYAAQIRSK